MTWGTLQIDSQINFKKIASQKADILVSYNDTYNEKIELDISQYSWMLVYSSPLEDISQHIKQIKEEQKRFQNALLKKIIVDLPNPMNVIMHKATNRDSKKLQVYKALCISDNPTTKTISSICEFDIELTHDLLTELALVDDLVDVDLDESILDEDRLWYHK